MDQGRQERHQVDTTFVQDVPQQCRPAPASCPGLQSGQLHADSGLAGGGGALVSDHTAGKVGEDRCESGEPRAVRHVPIGRGGGAERLVPKDPEADR